MKQVLLSVIVALIAFNLQLSAQLPFVYDKENTGSACQKPALPHPSALANYQMLPDPFGWSDGSGRVTEFSEWECRRNEIKAEIENYEIGVKPPAPASVTASFDNNVLTVTVTENGETLTLTSSVTIPAGEGPFPVVIGMNSGTGSLPASLFENVIRIAFMHNQVVTYSQTSNRTMTDPYYKLYPNLTHVGNYSAWSWGISRLIDGIHLVKDQLKADPKRLAVTGCSYAGKMALFAGALDERIALTIAQESGGGGVNAWRVSETIGEVEKLGNTNYSWFMQSLKTNFEGRVGTLPYDHHELMAMIVPRALLVLGNPPFVWLGDESGYVSCRAAEEVYKFFGIADRFGFSFRSGHDHCSLPTASYPEVTAFVDKFLFGKEDINTTLRVHEFPNVDYNKWINAWKQAANPNAPKVNITEPVSGAVLDAPATITVRATVTDADNNLVKVMFYNNNTKLGELTEAPFELHLTNLTAGIYNISAEAVDQENLVGYSNVVSFTVKNPTAKIFKPATVPVIDGTIDPIWNDERNAVFKAENLLVGTNVTPTDLSGYCRLLWDEQFVYLLAEVTDDVKMKDSQNTYEDDNVEVYFDANNSKGSSYDTNDVQYSFRWNDGTAIGVLPSGRASTGIVYSIAATDQGYVVEAKIPWSTLQTTPVHEQQIGFEFMINDDDDGSGRDVKLSWNASSDQAWQNASLFGTIQIDAQTIVAVDHLSAGWSISPNPVRDELTINGLNNQACQYRIYTVAGQLLAADQTEGRISVAGLAGGMYLLQVTTPDGERKMKFRVQ